MEHPLHTATFTISHSHTQQGTVSVNTSIMNESSSTLPVLLQEGMEDLQKDFAQEEQEQEGREEGEGGALTAACSCYLDHAGATLASRRQLQDVFRALTAAPLSNPHSVHNIT